VKEEFAGLADILENLIGRSESISVAESLTGGGLAQALTSLPGSSAVFRGSVTAYQNEIKSSLLQIPAELISEFGAVSEEVANVVYFNHGSGWSWPGRWRTCRNCLGCNRWPNFTNFAVRTIGHA